jgi:hypothetical protein
MPVSSDYKITSIGAWRLALLQGAWSRDLESQVLEAVEAQCWSKHPQTLAVRLPHGGERSEFFLKVFHVSEGWAAVKDMFRVSRAFRAWRMGLALHKLGFNVPLTVAAGEQRRCRFLRRAFILTQKIDGQAVHLFLAGRVQRSEAGWTATAKRAELQRLAHLVRRLHENGFVHGDLVASNILVGPACGDNRAIYFMDNDRTRRYRVRAPQVLLKRNLIQLNRMPLAGITLQDRMRFFHAYLGKRRLSRGERRLARWCERKTRERRHQCDGVHPSGDFRRLMRWSADMSALATTHDIE